MAVAEADAGMVRADGQSESLVERLFKVRARGSTVGTEVRAGISTFRVMSYTIAMGLFANYPFDMAAGLGLNAVAAFQLHVQMKLPWEAVMGVFFWEGLVITILVLTGLRELIIDAIPMSLKRA